ncbi:MAG: DUF47 family protein [Acetobacterium sp.]|nr:DUF47 family protein [Bacillota bacterium]MCG2728929.1 DUF47 family protein [Acetobacterium sp.]
MEKRNIIDRIFPIKYHFHQMLIMQAQSNALGVGALCNWLKSGSEEDSEAVTKHVKEADETRMEMEKNLTEAFVTPYDRGDIYSISVGMNRVLKYAQSTLVSMKAFDVNANDTIIDMVEQLNLGVEVFAEAIGDLKKNHNKSEDAVAKMRETHQKIEGFYIEGMSSLFSGGDSMDALKKREVYHHIKDASTNLEETVDVLHRIIVRLT